jgi:DNA-binding response OmpR family regulator
MLMCPSTGEQIVLLPGALYGSKGEVDLTEEEHRIMRLLMTRPGVLVYREALQLAVWGRLISPGSRALDMHISILRKKIRSAGTIDPKLDPIPSVRRIGYRIAHDFVKDESIANRDNCEQAG